MAAQLDFDLDDVSVSSTDPAAPLPEACQPDAEFEDKLALARESLVSHIKQGYHLVVGTSFGKDSSVTNAIVCSAMQEAMEQGVRVPHVVFAHAMTGYDNPVIDTYTQGEIKALRDYIEKNRLPASVEVAEPTLSNDYLVNIVGGRMVATMPGTGRACADMLKVQTSRQLKRRLKQKLPGQTLNVVGKRWDESAARATNMAEAGERPDQAVKVNGEALLSPIAHFTLDDIWMMVGMAKLARESETAAAYETYTDFEAMTQAYRDGNGGDCMVNAFAQGKAGSSGCGARFGCWNCSQVQNDLSMENMVADTHPHLAPLLAIRQFIIDNHWDPDNRRWLSRDPDQYGNLKIEPNAYSPAFCRDLLRFILSAQADEEERAEREGTVPAFEIFDERKLIAVQSLWARYGYHEPWAALRDWHHIYENKANRYYPSACDAPADRASFPRVAGGRLPLTVFTGEDARQLQNPAWGLSGECLPWAGEGDDPRPEVDPNIPMNSDGVFDVDADGAELFVWIAGPDQIRKAHELDPLMKPQDTEPEAYAALAESAPELIDQIRRDSVEAGRAVGTRPSDMVRTLLGYGCLQVREQDRGSWEQMLSVADSLAWSRVTEIMDDPKALQQLARSIERYGGGLRPEHLDAAEAVKLEQAAQGVSAPSPEGAASTVVTFAPRGKDLSLPGL